MTVSCVCPTGNRQRFINDSLRCFVNQARHDTELIVIDDGVVPTLVPPWVRYFRVPKMSIGAKLNYGIERAGEVIVRWDDDDLYGPDCINAAVYGLTSHLVSGFDAWDFYEMESNSAYRIVSDRWNLNASGTGLAFHKRWWEDKKFEDISINEDVDFVGEARNRKKLIVTSGVGHIVVRRHASCTSAGDSTSKQFMPVANLPSWSKEFC